MLVIMIKILKLIMASSNHDDYLMTRNIREQLISLVCKKVKDKDFIALENAIKDLYAYVTNEDVVINNINIMICHVYENCKTNHNYTYTVNNSDIDDPNLFNIFNFFKSFNVERVFLSSGSNFFNICTTLNSPLILTDLLNRLSERNEGPKFFYETHYFDHICFHKNKRCIDPYCDLIAADNWNPRKFDFRITNDNKAGYMFLIDSEQLDCCDFIKKKINLLYKDNWEPVYNFLINFDYAKSLYYNNFIFKIKCYFSLENEFYFKDENFFTITEKNIVFHEKIINKFDVNEVFVTNTIKSLFFQEKIIYKVDVNEAGDIQIDIAILKDFQRLVLRLLSIYCNHFETKIFTVFSLFTKQLFTCLVKRILYSGLSAKKILLLEVLFSIGIIKRSDINWFLDCNSSIDQDFVFEILNEFYITKIVNSIMNIGLKDGTSFYYIYFYIIIYFELEIYIDECESNKEKSFVLLENYYKLLEVKDICIEFVNRSETTVVNICNIYYGLMKKLNIFYKGFNDSFKEYYCLVKTALNDLLEDKDFIKKFLSN